MTNVAFRLGKVRALADVVVLDVNTYDVLFALCALVALRANLDFERRSVILRNIGGKSYVIPIILALRTSVKVYSDTFYGHAQHIEWTLGALRDAGFKIALEKSEFFLPEISFLGYVVTRGGLRPDSRKVAAVKEAPVPISLTQVRAFLGLASYLRPGCRRLLTQELTVPIAQLADGLDVSIVSHVDPRLVPHVTSRTLSPYLQWSTCVEGFPSRIPPSRLNYLDPRDIVDPAFYRPPYEDEFEEIIREELAEESSEEEEENLNEDEGEPAQ
ncbi:hypothetical protein CBR_g50681 [Chara braunii]|uniref:Reverse transcriptase domain-containing protein n=1 Tax=Chara braunii TaxID=69332 RepID=A0A388M765_CHABU|nr:hypothetical protein CBR_g50681 [Chara braunii]|eukprot:GBG90434.1 hypothetical protein CBR_g50681 [Chara braunii]